ncbi:MULTISPECIES: hypothetical protein [Lysinibacillus]|uniref:hypothetical protein n=1 Tax=Lysinibacillus TaxID=400634 RepID=UPI00214AF598|nr:MULTISPECIES: hypothetical protein [Lysinibacillus]UNT55175.1 hypothetical protein ICJ70_22150 [Lysinibacillus capsici]UUV24950.1 hypothetical protein NP781_25010 [Lysinibacillus sp. FN11]UYB47820.1 hypothetical protein OCI51_02365 [Lysinibacillus capsici]
MRFIEGAVGLVFIMFGSLLMNITVEDAMTKNITLRIVGGIAMFIGIIILNRAINKGRNKTS